MTKEKVQRKIVEFCVDSSIQVIAHRVVQDFVWSLILDGRPEGTCEQCSETFPMVRKDQKFCKRACKKQAHNLKRSEKDAGKDYEK